MREIFELACVLALPIAVGGFAWALWTIRRTGWSPWQDDEEEPVEKPE